MQTRHISSRTLAALVAGLLTTNLASAATNTWSGAGANDDWSTPGNWLGGTPGPANDTLFTNLDATGISGPWGTPNNIVNASVAIRTLKYGQTNEFHTTQIPLGSTLTVTGSVSPIMVVGSTAYTTNDLGNAATVYATLLGQGALFVTNNSGVIMIIQGTAAGLGTKRATLDLEGLDTFTAYVSQIRVGAENGGSSTPWYNRGAGTLTLAKTNHIYLGSTAGTAGLFVAQGSGNSAINIVNLGQTNAFFSDAGITIGGRKAQSGTLMAFNPAFVSPGVLFRNRAGTGRQSQWLVGDNLAQDSGTTGSTGAIDLSNGTVDALVSTITLGRAGAVGGTAPGVGTLTFSAGAIDVNTLELGVSSGGAGTGTVNVNGTGLLVANTLIRLAVGATASGTLSINGGTVRANSIINGGGTTKADISMNGGTLVLTNTAGSVAAPILNFTMADSTLTLPATSIGTNIVVTALSASGTTTNNTINVLSLPAITGYPAQFPLISYGYFIPSGGTDFLLGSMPASSPPYSGYISNNTTTSTIDLVITNGPATLQALVWNGIPTGDWNTSTPNWQGSKTYAQNDFVTFDDTASGTTNVNLTTILTPGSLTISNSTKNYTFSGSGSIGGAVALVKDGASTLTLANSGINTFTNGVSILGGTVKIGGSDDRLPTTSVVTLAEVSGATLDLNNLNQTLQSLNGGGDGGGEVKLGAGTLTVVGGGTCGAAIIGTGRLIKTNLVTGGTLTLTNANTYSGGTIVGGYTNNTTLVVANQTGSGTGPSFVRVLTNGTFSLGNGGPGGSVAAGVLTNDGTVRLNRSDDFTFTNTLVGTGILDKQNTNTVTITAANSYAGGTTINGPTPVLSPSILRISHPAALGSGTVDIGNRGTLQLTGGITLLNPTLVGAKPSTTAVGSPNVENLSGSNTLAGNLQLTQNGAQGWIFMAAADHLLISGAMTPLNGSQTSQNTTRTLWLRGDAAGEWSGNIIDPVGGTTNLALRKDGLGTWTLSGANTYSAATVVSNGTLVVNGSISPSSTLTVHGGTLAGMGVIGRPVTINPEGTLAPGNSIGGLTINNSLTNNGTIVMEVSHAATDRIVGLTTVNYGGTLKVIVSGSLTGGEVFKLFSANTYNNTFAGYDLPTLTPPLDWDTANLAVDGTLRVTGGTLMQPALQVSQTGSQLTFSWNDVSFKLQAQTNALSTGISGNWGDYPGGGYSPVAVTVSPANPAVFFRLVSQ